MTLPVLQTHSFTIVYVKEGENYSRGFCIFLIQKKSCFILPHSTNLNLFDYILIVILIKI